MIEILKKEFLAGFREGWAMFWSPFTGLYRSIKGSWRSHVDAANQGHRHA